jgi:hypothetical protein
MLSNAELETGSNAVRASRARKAQQFMHDRGEFMRQMVNGIAAAQRKAQREGLKLCVRPNGATDIVWEGIRYCDISIFETFPDVQFVDYTKNYRRMLRFCQGKLPGNYHLTFSRSETNWPECLDVLRAAGNVAVVFAEKPASTTTFNGWPVVDGDAHDLRHLDPKGGVIIALSPKGRKTKLDQSGFVVR